MKKEFVVDRNGKSFVLYAGLLDEAHSQGLREIQTELVQSPQDSNGQVAIARARVCTDKGCGREITKGQYEYSLKTFGQALCPSCQRQRSGGSKSFLSLDE